MAKQVVCDWPVRGDICGEIVETPLEIKRGNKTFELELCDDHQKPVSKVLDAVGARPRSKAANGTTNGHVRKPKSIDITDAAVRAWAAREGIDVNPVGRVPNQIRDQYAAAH